jgi:cytochrome c553
MVCPVGGLTDTQSGNASHLHLVGPRPQTLHLLGGRLRQPLAHETLFEREWRDGGRDAKLRQQVFGTIQAMLFGPRPPACETPVMAGWQYSARIAVDLAIARQLVRVPDDRYRHFAPGRIRVGCSCPCGRTGSVRRGYPYCHQGDLPDTKYALGHSCKEFTPPVVNLGAHVAPLGMKFYTGNQFPAEYKSDIFIAEYGSWTDGGGAYGRGRAQPRRLLRKPAAQCRAGADNGGCGIEGERRGGRRAASLRCLPHMDDFRGKQAAASIANQREDYLAKALADYRSQARPSVGVAAMTEAASGLSDDEIAALAHYLATL